MQVASTKMSYKESKYRAKKPLELLLSDVFGQVKHPSVGENNYIATFIDDYTRYAWVYFTKENSKSLQRFKEFRSKAESDLDKKVNCMHTNNGGKYTAIEFKEYLRGRIRR